MVKAIKSIGALEKQGMGKLTLTPSAQSGKPLTLSLGNQEKQLKGLSGNVQWSYANHETPIQK